MYFEYIFVSLLVILVSSSPTYVSRRDSTVSPSCPTPIIPALTGISLTQLHGDWLVLSTLTNESPLLADSSMDFSSRARRQDSMCVHWSVAGTEREVSLRISFHAENIWREAGSVLRVAWEKRQTNYTASVSQERPWLWVTSHHDVVSEFEVISAEPGRYMTVKLCRTVGDEATHYYGAVLSRYDPDSGSVSLSESELASLSDSLSVQLGLENFRPAVTSTVCYNM